jgi:hypothetical protein
MVSDVCRVQHLKLELADGYRCELQKGCTLLAAASDKVYQLFAHDRWFSLDTSASSTTKTGRHDIAETNEIMH